MAGEPFASAVALVDQSRTMPHHEMVRHLFDQYRASRGSGRDAIVLALIGALATARTRPPGGGDAGNVGGLGPHWPDGAVWPAQVTRPAPIVAAEPAA